MDLKEHAVTARDSVKGRARALFVARPIEHHALFELMERDVLPLADARAIALDIHHVVSHFPRFLSAAITALEDHRLRMLLVQNLYLEHGAMEPTQVHAVTYRHFLHGLGLTDEDIDGHVPALGAVA